ncbi:MAG: class I SAM-dependent methyltransferase [Zoogloeaceae bacterium]|nr:class I SAM-dependent methyltransferase [Zoogloeaceae bacterium]
MFLALQALAALIVFFGYQAAFGVALGQGVWMVLALVTGALAVLLAVVFRRPWWQWPMHMAFCPALVWGLGARLPPWIFLLLFVLCWLVFRGAAKNRVPLFFSSATTARAMADRLPQGASVVDLGAGIGSLLVPLARLRPDLRLAGVENAPLVWFFGRLRTAGQRIDWLYGDFFEIDLSGVEALYAFLSPEPMPALWKKACDEMRPGTLFSSKAFAVPEVAPEHILNATGKRRDALFFYRIPA